MIRILPKRFMSQSFINQGSPRREVRSLGALAGANAGANAGAYAGANAGANAGGNATARMPMQRDAFDSDSERLLGIHNYTRLIKSVGSLVLGTRHNSSTESLNLMPVTKAIRKRLACSLPKTNIAEELPKGKDSSGANGKPGMVNNKLAQKVKQIGSQVDEKRATMKREQYWRSEPRERNVREKSPSRLDMSKLMPVPFSKPTAANQPKLGTPNNTKEFRSPYVPMQKLREEKRDLPYKAPTSSFEVGALLAPPMKKVAAKKEPEPKTFTNTKAEPQKVDKPAKVTTRKVERLPVPPVKKAIWRP